MQSSFNFSSFSRFSIQNSNQFIKKYYFKSYIESVQFINTKVAISFEAFVGIVVNLVVDFTLNDIKFTVLSKSKISIWKKREKTRLT